MTTSVILNIVFAGLIVGGFAAVCRTAYIVASGRFDARPQSPAIVENRYEEERLAA